ncbi:MAG: hypothetical protein AAF899_08775 [Pseudomonadota bacterium]
MKPLSNPVVIAALPGILVTAVMTALYGFPVAVALGIATFLFTLVVRR